MAQMSLQRQRPGVENGLDEVRTQDRPLDLQPPVTLRGRMPGNSLMTSAACLGMTTTPCYRRAEYHGLDLDTGNDTREGQRCRDRWYRQVEREPAQKTGRPTPRIPARSRAMPSVTRPRMPARHAHEKIARHRSGGKRRWRAECRRGRGKGRKQNQIIGWPATIDRHANHGSSQWRQRLIR
jgi:hypothetical protein